MKSIKKYRYLLVIFFLITLFIICIIRKNNLTNKGQLVEVDIIDNQEEKQEVQGKIKVEIKGYIKYPGVYELEENSRVVDLINAAGGLLDNADISLINQSKKLKDEMVIIIYSKEEVANSNLKQIETVYKVIEKECICPAIENDGCINTKIEENNTLVNINTATIEVLQTIDGIGESKAKSIIEYRETNGNFNTIEDIMNVSGIGESLFAKIKDYITV